jgi:hypothetical protein
MTETAENAVAFNPTILIYIDRIANESIDCFILPWILTSSIKHSRLDDLKCHEL